MLTPEQRLDLELARIHDLTERSQQAMSFFQSMGQTSIEDSVSMLKTAASLSAELSSSMTRAVAIIEQNQ